MRELMVVRDAESLASVAAKRFTASVSDAIAERGCFTVALSGGSTPKPVYQLLAEDPHASRVDWARVHVFWGDERCVPPEHPDSNYRMAAKALLDRVAIPAGNVHRIPGELPPEEAATAYRAELVQTLGEDGRLDMVLLGMGTDGHTASLFPGTTAVDEQERDVVAVYVPKLATWRVTLTLPVMNASRCVMFLVSGASKAAALARVRTGETLPAGLVQPVDGQLLWLVDRAAAAGSSETRRAVPIGPALS